MSDDFFSVRPVHPDADTDVDSHSDFAYAISLRFGSADLRTARLLPGDLPTLHPPSPSPSRTALPSPLPFPPPRAPSPPLPPFASVPPSALVPYLADPRSLVLDIRPHAAHASARITHAISLSVPTTLLKRPLFSLSKLSQMLPSPSSRTRFADWSSASCILVYDSDSAVTPDNSIIAGLLRKFRAEGFSGELGWVRGGFQAIWKEARDLTTTEPPIPEEDDPDAASSAGTLRTTHLPKAAFSLHSTTAAPPPQFSTFPGPHPIPNTPAPSTSRAANPFFDTIRQNVELSHGITDRIPLRLSRRVRRRIHDLPFRWLQDIARRSALRHSSPSRHPGFDSLESGSESSDDPHTSDPDEHDPSVEEGTEALAMQFYRIELAEQRRLRSIMEHHSRESQITVLASSVKPRRGLDKGVVNVGADRAHGAVNVQTGAKTVPTTPHLAFPFSITAGVEKGAKNRYTHIWPFEHARVRLHDSRHQGSHPGRRDKGKTSERGRGAKERSGERAKTKEEGQHPDKQRRSRSSPAYGKSEDEELPEAANVSGHSFYFDARSSAVETRVGLAHPTLSFSIPRVKIEYDVAEQDSRMSEPPTPVTALPLLTPPFYTPMEMPSALAPMRGGPPLLPHPAPGLGGTQPVLPASGSLSLGPLPSFPLRLPNRPGGLLPSIGEQPWPSESLSSSGAYFGASATTVEEAAHDTATKRDARREPSPADDYVNASYVQPLGTRKRYIATQGPLPSTFVDFWTLVWEQNVHVIVMLTREVENAMVKCGSYWTDTEYGPLRLELLSTSPPMSPSANMTSADILKQGFFAIREPRAKASGVSGNQPVITRVFALSHVSYPAVPPRRVTHIQYLDWSDMNVPDDPRGVLDIVKRVDQVVVESTPGPSPSGRLSPRSGNSSLSGSQSPDFGSEQKGNDTSLLSPGAVAWGGNGKQRGSQWRHPELDPKTGIADSALGKPAPVLLHCSAGVGRTGGFIAVDAVLDGIRSERRKNREERRLRKASRLGVVASTTGKVCMNAMEARGMCNAESGRAGGKRVEEGTYGQNERMDVDEPTTDKAEKTQDALRAINTVPIHVSAGDHPKGRGRHYHGKDSSAAKRGSSSESLVVHVPCAGTSDVPQGTNVAGIRPIETGWYRPSTREWVEQVSDQTHAHAEEGDSPMRRSLPPSGRERSPGSTSNSSGPTASADSCTNGNAGENASGGTSISRNESINRAERKSDAGSLGSESVGPPPSSMSRPWSGSRSLSNSGSGTGEGSRFGSSLLRTRLQDSSVTSMSVGSTDSLLPEHKPQAKVTPYRPSPVHTSSGSDMEIDCPPRPVYVPLQPVHSSATNLQRAVHSRHHKPTLAPLPIASVSSPIFPNATTERDTTEGSASHPSSDAGSDGLTSPPHEFESGGADAEGSGKNGQGLSDESEEVVPPTKSGSNLRLTGLGSLEVPVTLHSSGSVQNPLSSRETKGKERSTIPPVSLAPEGLTTQLLSTAPAVPGRLYQDQRAADHPVIDYKLPRELHSDLSPPLISSFADPIFMVVQDMREQRMSLCQSLRQYIFVHAAIIEGALRIVDEEREMWTSDEVSSAEEEFGWNVKKGGQHEANTWVGGVYEAEAAVMTPEAECGSTPHGTHPSHAIPSLNRWSSEGKFEGGHVPMRSMSPSSGVSSPSKGKRGPSPTELVREDKTGALSLNKRPSIQRKMKYEDDELSLGSSNSSPMADESMADVLMGLRATQAALGRPGVPERGSTSNGGAR